MDIKELKHDIELKTIENRFMIWILENEYSKIIADQYINKLCDIWGLNRKAINSLDDIPDESFVVDDNLYIINVDKWEDNRSHDNCIVLCNKSKNGIKIPGLNDWQIIDYVIPKLRGLDKEDLEWLLTYYNGNYFRFINDVNKISIFNESVQKLVFNQMIEDCQFDSLTNLTIWDLSNAIIKKDIRLIKEVLKVINYIDISPLGLSTVLLNNFRNIINIQTNPSCTANDLGISDKQFFVIKKYNVGYYTEKQLVDILEMLTNVEFLYKYEDLSLSNLIEYMICKILGV